MIPRKFTFPLFAVLMLGACPRCAGPIDDSTQAGILAAMDRGYSYTRLPPSSAALPWDWEHA